MDTVQTKGNTQHGQATDLGEGQRGTEHRAWTFHHEPWSPQREREASMEVVSSGSMIEAVGGFVAVVLGILSLANVAPVYLLGVAAIVIGTALLIEGGSVAVRFWKLPAEISTGRWAATQLATGMIAGFLGGVTGVVLGILSLAGVDAVPLMSVSVLIFGAALLFGSDLTLRLNYLETVGEEGNLTGFPFGHRATLVAAGVQVVFGVMVMLLAILALVGIAPLALTKIGMLAVGVSALLSGSAVTRRIMGALHRC